MKNAAEKRAMVAELIHKLNMAAIRVDLCVFFGQEACPHHKHKVIEKLLNRCEWLAENVDSLTMEQLEYSRSGLQEVSDWERLDIRF